MSHIMLQSDTLANEFNDILNGVEIFAPFQPLDPAVTFYAPLRHSVRDLRLSQDFFERASDAWFKDASGLYRRATFNQPRFENGELLMEPAGTNVCVNYNANPDPALSALVSSQTLRRIFNPADLMAAGLQDICPSGYVIELENEGGETGGVYINGGTGTSTADWTASGFINTFGNNVRLTITGTGSHLDINSNQLERFEYTAAPDGNFRVWQITNLAPGAKVQFVLNQLEESRIVTSPIVTEGTAGQRAIEELFWNRDPVESAEGMLIFNWTPRFDNVDHPSGVQSYSGIFSLRENSNASMCRYVRNTSNAAFLQVTDGVNVQNLGIDDPSKNITFTYALQWQGSEYHQGYKRSDTNLWTWRGDRSPYKGDWVRDGGIWLSKPEFYPQSIGEVYVYNEYRDEQWIEDNH